MIALGLAPVSGNVSALLESFRESLFAATGYAGVLALPAFVPVAFVPAIPPREALRSWRGPVGFDRLQITGEVGHAESASSRYRHIWVRTDFGVMPEATSDALRPSWATPVESAIPYCPGFYLGEIPAEATTLLRFPIPSGKGALNVAAAAVCMEIIVDATRGRWWEAVKWIEHFRQRFRATGT